MVTGAVLLMSGVEDYAATARTAYLTALPAVGATDVHCRDCSADPRRSCLSGGRSVPAHPPRVELAARVTAERIAEADVAADAARTVAACLAAGVPPNRMGRHVVRAQRVAYLMAFGWRPLYCSDSSPWRSPYPQMPDRYSLAFAFGWTVQEHAVFLDPEGVSGVCVTCKDATDDCDRFGLPRCVGCAAWLGVAA
ncbi:hypothetical protein AB0K35_28225 [Micromonospora sp. NPDC053740]|uniref:hypothetical protein n=1 Tax=Micromonospora sp. NPDC053740 TaxID=3155173 RepID=UPI0034196AA5